MTANSIIAIMFAMIGWLHLLSAVVASERKFNVVAKRANDKIEITSNDRATTVAIRSPFGISSAVVSRVDDLWPEQMILRLHLQGLDNLKLSNGKMELVAQAARPDGKRFLHITNDPRQRSEPEATKLTGSEIRSFDKAGKPTNAAPLIDGYFEVCLPQELFTDNSESITISWIDFYR